MKRRWRQGADVVRRFGALGIVRLFRLGFSLVALGATALAAQQGTVSGTVVDSAGAPLAGVHVRVRLDRGSLAMITGDDGRFTLNAVPAGRWELVARRIGFQVATVGVTVPLDSTVVVNVRMRAQSQALPGVVVAAAPGNVLAGVVMDASGKPIAGVTAEVLGLRIRLETGEDGRFAFYDLPAGVHLLQWRKHGYRVGQRGVTMMPGLQRDFSINLRAIGRDRYTAARAADVAQELDLRRRHAGSQAIVIGRDVLEPFGRRRLFSVLDELPAASVGRGDPIRSCLLINGFEPAEFDPWFYFYRADEVEMLEIYPEGSENSRSMCGRFPPRFKGCTCHTEPSGYVIWLKSK